MHLARIHGTEEDRVNCPFFYKIGACRHGDRCSRLHTLPTFSQTILIPHMYPNPKRNLDPNAPPFDPKKDEEDFEDFYEEVFDELASFGFVEEMHVCDNLSDHMLGNVYVKFRREEDAERCKTLLSRRLYKGTPLRPEFSPVTDFREARCRQHDETKCSRGGYCNFMHIKRISRTFQRDLISDQDEPSSSSESSDSDSSADEDVRRDRDEKETRQSRSRSREKTERKSRSRSRE